MTAQGFHCVLQDFLVMGADIHAWGRHGTTLLHEAALAENPEYACFFLEQGLAASATDDKGRTALHCAARSESRTVYDWLLAREEFKSLAVRRMVRIPTFVGMTLYQELVRQPLFLMQAYISEISFVR